MRMMYCHLAVAEKHCPCSQRAHPRKNQPHGWLHSDAPCFHKVHHLATVSVVVLESLLRLLVSATQEPLPCYIEKQFVYI